MKKLRLSKEYKAAKYELVVIDGYGKVFPQPMTYRWSTSSALQHDAKRLALGLNPEKTVDPYESFEDEST